MKGYMAFEQTWRWFGPKEPISLKEIKQTGATGIVTALHQIPVGEVWAIGDILERKELIESEGLTWSVVESLPIHENIKKRKADYVKLIEKYKESVRNLGKCGVDIICYNFMPVLDWSRTDLGVKYSDGSLTSKFEIKAFAAFDLFILERNGAEKDYTLENINTAKQYYDGLDKEGKDRLTQTILFGLPGSGDAYTIKEFKSALNEYKDIGDKELRTNLYSFLKEITPAAEESGVFLAIHPDDPPRPLLGLPRVVSNKKDFEQIIAAYDSQSNGITFCTGSLGAGYNNDLPDIANTIAKRVNFIHLRNVRRNENGDFIEEYHLDGDVDMYSVMKILLMEQKSRIDNDRKNFRMPLRPDHGHLMLDDLHTRTFYPGYSLYGRMRGLAELRGLELGISRSLGIP